MSLPENKNRYNFSSSVIIGINGREISISNYFDWSSNYYTEFRFPCPTSVFIDCLKVSAKFLN